jgi:acyl carrier protein
VNVGQEPITGIPRRSRARYGDATAAYRRFVLDLGITAYRDSGKLRRSQHAKQGGAMAQEFAVNSAVKNFILSEFLPDEDPENLTATTPLMSSGILDSIATLKLITFLEQEFNIQIDLHEVDQARFNTLESISRLVNAKLA